jgi:plastocyanin
MKSDPGRAVLVALCILAAAIAPAMQFSPAEAATVEVTISTKDAGKNVGAFTPTTVTAKQGDTVKWVNADKGTHTVVSGQAKDRDAGTLFRSDDIRSGRSFSHTFIATGTYHYFCKIHPVMAGTVVVESAPPALSLSPFTQAYPAGQQLTVRGSTSLVSAEPVSIEVYNPAGEQYILDSASVAKDGSFSYSFVSAQAAGAHRVVAKYLGATAVTTFQVAQGAGAPSSGIAVSAVSSGRSVTVAVKNLLPDDIYSVSFTFSGNVGSTMSPRDWDSDHDGRTAEFSTELRPIYDGKRVAFRVLAESPVASLSWVAFDESGDVLGTGSAAVRAR